MASDGISFKYRCRLCGRIQTGPTTGNPKTVQDCILRLCMGERCITGYGIPVSTMEPCRAEGCFGIADLLGAQGPAQAPPPPPPPSVRTQ
jgi:hypothetical protein